MAVVVAVDDSDGAWNAIRLAAKEAAWRQARLIAVTVYGGDQAAGAAAGQPPGLPQTSDGDRAAAESALRETVRDVLGDDDDQSYLVDMKAVPGLAGRAIVETAREARAQLIVLAVRAGIIVLPGTVSQYVLRHARCPVLLVPAGRRAD
jgi:nucleotide-binding universal stress UspA family protein